MAHFAYGEPRFVFYPPASWTLGAGLSAIFPWTLAASIYIWIVLVAAGASMFVLARRWLDRRDAIFAAVLYAVNPYHLVIVYWRSAFAELLAACLVPLLLLFVLKAAEERSGAVVPLGFILAGAWLTNAPAAVMIHYSLALLLVSSRGDGDRRIFCWWERRRSGLEPAWRPSICFRRFTSRDGSTSRRPCRRDRGRRTIFCSFTRRILIMMPSTASSPGSRFWKWSSSSSRLWQETWRSAKRELWSGLLIWAVACSVLMFPVSLLLWKILPKMQFMQFPWRWLLCLSMIFTIFVMVGMRRWWMRGAVCAVSILIIVLAWHRVQAPWWDNAADLREMQDNMATGAGYEGTDEYTPVGADPAAIDKDARAVTVDGPAHAAIKVFRWDAESKIFTAEMSGPDQLALRLFRYPAWKTEVNGQVVETDVRAATGQMLVPVQAGMNRVQIRFVRTWDRTVGGWISAVTLLCLALCKLWARRRALAS